MQVRKAGFAGLTREEKDRYVSDSKGARPPRHACASACASPLPFDARPTPHLQRPLQLEAAPATRWSSSTPRAAAAPRRRTA
jgi:hypothetical protein